MLHGREYWCWPDSTFSCDSKIYKQANYANHFLGMNSELGELASSVTFKLQLRLPDHLWLQREHHVRWKVSSLSHAQAWPWAYLSGASFSSEPSSPHKHTLSPSLLNVSLPSLPTEKASLDHSDPRDRDGKSMGKNKRHCAVKTRNWT